jgi:hypothetical protein
LPNIDCCWPPGGERGGETEADLFLTSTSPENVTPARLASLSSDTGEEVARSSDEEEKETEEAAPSGAILLDRARPLVFRMLLVGWDVWFQRFFLTRRGLEPSLPPSSSVIG